MADALIIGGGLIGITTAHRLAKRGCSVVLV
ncbi:MAG: FAD-dependent oxidoreductase [Tateyamaria sp.]|nr:FAD-dependent oxidoreductase [Tateyamaria sp.]